MMQRNQFRTLSTDKELHIVTAAYDALWEGTLWE
jgi:hypothetical protein